MNFSELRKPPHTLGFDPKRLKRVEELIEQGIADKLFPSATYVVMRYGLIAAEGAFGVAQPDSTPPTPARLETIFDLASITKCITAAMLLQCVEEGRLHLGQEVRQVLPEAEKSPVGHASLRALATHTSGLPAWKPVYQAPSPLTDILETALTDKPGARYTYSDLGYILLGNILERVLGQPLETLAHDRVFAPLGMAQAGFCPTPNQFPLLAATTAPLGQVHDPNTRGMNGVAGHAGAFASAPDMVRFCLSLAYPTAAGHFGVPALLGPLARRLASTRQTPPELDGHSIGYFTYPSGYLPYGDLLSSRTFGHTGFTGTSLVFDPEHDLALLLLTNRVYYENINDGTGVLRLRRLFSNLVGGAIVH
jgi:CubicO group peptidase (beta-lactamase class C family)